MSWLSLVLDKLKRTKPLDIAANAAAGAILNNKPPLTAVGDAYLDVMKRAAEQTFAELTANGDVRALATKVLQQVKVSRALLTGAGCKQADARLAELQAALEEALG